MTHKAVDTSFSGQRCWQTAPVAAQQHIQLGMVVVQALRTVVDMLVVLQLGQLLLGHIPVDTLAVEVAHTWLGMELPLSSAVGHTPVGMQAAGTVHT